MLTEHDIEIRVRYHETDAQGHVHHGTYVNYFELARTEMLRSANIDYAGLEASGVLLVVSSLSIRYFQPCRFGDTIQVNVKTVKAKGARILHQYRVTRDGDLLAEGETTIASIDRSGKVRRLPAIFFG